MARTLIVGDVHGCAAELQDLLLASGFGDGDALVLVGDLVAKGPDSRGVLRITRERGARAVRGNHDHAVLRWREPLLAGTAPAKGGPHHLGVARSLDAQDWQTLLALPLLLPLPELGALVVHAGLVPGKPLAAQDADMLMNMRTLRPDGTASRKPEDGVLWGTRWGGPALVVFGHHATAGLQRHPHAIGLDTGCVYGGSLSGLWLPERRIVSVPARQAYAHAEGGPSRDTTST